VDALAAVRSAKQEKFQRRGEAEVIAFLDDYDSARGANPNLNWLSCRNQTEALQLIHLHEAVKRVADDFCHYVANKAPGDQTTLNLSQMEHLRLYRAMYRFQVFCNIFGDWGIDSPMGTKLDVNRPRDRPANVRILATFSPWEIEELSCVWKYLQKRWAKILREISDIFFPLPVGSVGWNGDSDMEDTFDHLRLTRLDSTDGMLLTSCGCLKVIVNVSN
jgi:hypothetical protein